MYIHTYIHTYPSPFFVKGLIIIVMFIVDSLNAFSFHTTRFEYTYVTARTFSITRRASWIGLAILRTGDTAPLASVLPSMTMASISTSPFEFNTDPHPEA